MVMSDDVLGHGGMSEEEFDDLTPLLLVGERGYTSDMELEFQKRWVSHPDQKELSQALRDLQPVNQNKPKRTWYRAERHYPLWKTCGVLLNCWAMSIITLDHHLVYEPDPNSSGSMIWNSAFCQAMLSIIVNERSRLNVPTIRLYLQYAVICRTNDTSLWPLDNVEANSFLEYMTNLIKQDKTRRRPIPDIHQEAVQKLYGPGSLRGRSRPDSSLVFEQIEKLAYRKETEPVQQSGCVCYKVRDIDLKCVVRAFDETRIGLYKPVLHSESVALWFSSSLIEATNRGRKIRTLSLAKSVSWSSVCSVDLPRQAANHCTCS